MGAAVGPLEGFVKYAEVNVANLEIARFMDYNKHNRKKSATTPIMADLLEFLLTPTKIQNLFGC